MSLILTDVRFLYDGHDLSADGNNIGMDESHAMLNKTNFTQSFNCFRPGLGEGKWSYAGYTAFGIGSVEETLNARRGIATGIPVVVAKTGDLGMRAHFFSAAQGSLAVIGNKAGEILGFTVEGTFGRGGAAAVGIINGPVLESGKILRVAPGQSTPVAMIGPFLGQNLYATVHLLALTGTNVTFKIQSAALVGFAGPTDRFNSGALTAVGGTMPTPLAGPITDGFFRVDWSGTFTSFLAMVVIGVL